jgi:hypothetical protein
MTNPAAEYAAAIDTQIAELETAAARTRSQMSRVADHIMRLAGATPEQDRRGNIVSWSMSFVDATDALRIDHPSLAEWEALSETLDHQVDGLVELRAIYAEHQWSRFFLVNNSNGHIHSSMSCGTCFPTTQYRWVTSLSGQTEAEAVAELGEILCSVCYPSAPSAWTDGESRATVEARAAREAKKAAAAAKKIEKALVPEDPTGGYTTVGKANGGWQDTITTTHAAKQWLTNYFEWKGYRGGEDHVSYQTIDAEAIAALLVGRPGVKEETPEAVLAAAEKRAAKRS